jgi:hypothetical protein
VTVEMVLGDKIVERDDDRLVEATGLGGAEHGALREEDRARARRAVYDLPPRRASVDSVETSR